MWSLIFDAVFGAVGATSVLGRLRRAIPPDPRYAVAVNLAWLVWMVPVVWLTVLVGGTWSLCYVPAFVLMLSSAAVAAGGLLGSRAREEAGVLAIRLSFLSIGVFNATALGLFLVGAFRTGPLLF